MNITQEDLALLDELFPDEDEFDELIALSDKEIQKNSQRPHPQGDGVFPTILIKDCQNRAKDQKRNCR